MSRTPPNHRTARLRTGSTLRTALFSWLLLLAVPPLIASADEEKGDGSTFELGEVVVTSHRPASEEVTTVTEVTRDDIDAWGDFSVADALQGIPGADLSLSPGALSGNGKQESLIRLRGFETTDVLIMLDGMPMTEPYLKRVDLNQIVLDNVAKIKVVKGPSSVLYGPNTAGGVVNIVTQQGAGFRTRGDVRAGDYRSVRAVGHHRGILGPVGYALGGSFDRSDGFPVSRDFEGARNQTGFLRENSDLERYNLAGRVGTDLGGRGFAAVSGGYYSSSGGVPYDMMAPQPSTLWRKGWDRWYVNGAGEWAFRDNLGIKAQAFYNRFENRITTYTDTSFREIAAGQDGLGISTYDNYILGYFLNPYWNLGRASHLRGGIRYTKDNVNIQSATRLPWQTYAAETFSFALEDEVRPFRSLSLVAGVGYNLYRKLKAGGGPPGDDVQTVDFQAGLLWAPSPYVKARAAVGRKTSFPTMRQLYSEDGGNPFLTEQTALLYEVGVEAGYRTRFPRGSLALFRSDVDGLIAKREFGNDFRFENVDEAVLQGVELTLGWDPLEPLGFLFAYTFLDSQDKRPDRVLREVDFRPRHQFMVQLRYSASFGLTVNSRYHFTSSQAYERKGVISPDPARRIAELPARGIWDIFIAQKIPFQRNPPWHVEAYLDVENVLDEYYEMDPGKAAPGRVVWAGLRAAF